MCRCRMVRARVWGGEGGAHVGGACVLAVGGARRAGAYARVRGGVHVRVWARACVCARACACT